MKKITALLLLSAVIAVPASAADEGFYVGANVGNTSDNLSGAQSATGFTVDGGYQFHKNFAVEVLYGDFGNIAPTGSLKMSGYSIDGVGILPFNDQWSGYLRLGVAGIDSKVSGSGLAGGDGTYKKTAATYGIGGQFNFNPQLGLRFGVDQYKSGGTQGIWMLTDNTLTVFSVGVNYKF